MDELLWVSLVVCLLIVVTYFVVGLLVRKGQNMDEGLWWGVGGGIALVAVLIIFGVGIGVSNSRAEHDRQTVCRTKAIAALVQNSTLSALDIRAILGQVCP